MMAKLQMPTVLLVDDDRITKELLRSFLRKENYPVVGEASNGAEAVMRCQLLKPNIVLLDINMPQMDGIQALEEIRRVSPATMVLMVSADSTLNKVKEALSKGASGFLVKPLKPASVMDKLRTCWNQKSNKGEPTFEL